MVNKEARLTGGILQRNPVLVLGLGLTPALALTTTVRDAFWMGLITAAVLICSNIVISIVRKAIPERARTVGYLFIIIGFVTIASLLLAAYAPRIETALGVFLPLIAVNYLVLLGADGFAQEKGIGKSIVDSFLATVGFLFALLVIGSVRELLGSGTWLGHAVTAGKITPFGLFKTAPGGFFIVGVLMALVRKLTPSNSEKEDAGNV